MYRFLIFCLPLWLFAEQITIEWHRLNFPPSLFYDAGDKNGKGYSDKPRIFMIENLPEYKHVDFPVSPNKAMSVAQKNAERTICFGGLNKNAKREAFLSFSKPFLLSYPNRIVARADNKAIKELLKKDGTISLQVLLDSGVTLSVAKSRAYSPEIDAILSDYTKDNLIYPPSGNISHAYLQQLVRRRVDATIDYPANINYFAFAEKKLNSKWFATYPISEDHDMLKVYFACSKKSVHTQEIIARINQLIDTNGRTFATYYAEWLNDETAQTYLDRDWK